MADDTNIAVIERMRQRTWDYSVVTIHARHNDLLEHALKERGREGWELSFINMPIPNEYQCVFRRAA
jgi:hypothetical protein